MALCARLLYCSADVYSWYEDGHLAVLLHHENAASQCVNIVVRFRLRQSHLHRHVMGIYEEFTL